MADFEKTLGKVTWNAGQWRDMIQQYVVDRPYEDMRGLVVAKSIRKIMDVLMANLREAIAAPAGDSGAGEFDTHLLREPLLRTFNNEEIVQIMDDQVNLEEGAYLLAGDEQDWADGIEAARENLGLGGGKYTRRERANFWRDFIYGPARIGMDPNIYVEEDDDAERKRIEAIEMYDETMRARLMEWEGGAPYWIVLEYGNHNSTLAFPRFRGTHFLEKSRRAGQLLYEQTLYDVENQTENIVKREVDRFLDNPDSYEPFDMLATFYAEGKKYRVYVTKMMRIGVTLRIRRDR